MKIAGAVILYNSTLSCLDILRTYWDQVTKLYVIDNSESVNEDLKAALCRQHFIRYIYNGENLGIAHALNIAAENAVDDGFDYLLTMDDDSGAPPDMVPSMCRFLDSYPHRDQVGVVSAIHHEEACPAAYRPVLFTMTSGNLLNLSIYRKAGRFLESLFIDHVDHEYGLRLNQKGYQVIELPGVVLRHNLGEKKDLRYLNTRFVSHSPVRVYYFVRNGIVVARQYKPFRWIACKLIVKEIVKAVVLENDRLLRLRFIRAGIRDALRNKLGKAQLY